MSYKKTRKELEENGYEWVRVIESSVDQLVFESIKNLITRNPIYNAYLVEKNLTALSGSIQKCLELRNQINSLEDMAVKQALDYQIFDANSTNIKSLELSEWVASQLEAEKIAYTSSSAKFAESDHTLSAGFSSQVDALVTSAAKGIENDELRRTLIEKKWALIKSHQEKLKERHSAPGHALNYIERGQRIRKLLEEEVVTLYWRAKAVSTGFITVFDMDMNDAKLPELMAPEEDNFVSFLDDISVWARKKARWLTTLKHDESVYEHTISVNAPMVEQIRLEGEATFQAAMDGDGKIEINLSNYFPDELGRIRVIGIALSMDTDDSAKKDNFVAQKYLYSRAIVTPPAQIDPYKTDSRKIIPPVIVNNIATTDPNATPRFIKSPTFENIDPKQGLWSIQVADYLGYVDRAGRIRTKANVLDIKLHLYLASSVDPKEEKWDKAFWGKKP